MAYLRFLFETFFQAIPSVISAVIFLVIAFLVASLAKTIVVKGLKKIKADKYTDKLGVADEKTGSSVVFLGKLTFFIVFLLFLPAVLDKLGMRNVSAPISSMVSQFVNFIPNILAAAIILLVGVFVANIIRQLLTPILKRLNVDNIQEKVGIKTSEGTTISSIISYIIYVLILIPIIIATLQVLNISAISEPAIEMLNKIILFLPNIFVAIAIVIIGVAIAKIVGKLLTSILSGVGADAIVEKIGIKESDKLKKFSLSKVIGESVKYIIMLLFVVEAINVIELEVLKFVGAAIIAYLPFAISSVIIIVAAFLLATWIENLIRNNFPNAKFSAIAAKYTIIILAVFMVLNQLNIASTIVNAAFIIILAALAIAFAVAFGIGGREFAANTLKKAESKMAEETKEKSDK